MKRRLITSIFLALAVAVSSAVVLTGCSSKSYYYASEDGVLVNKGEIPDENASEEESEADESSKEESKTESKADESSEEESKADESSEEESKADESSEEESKADESSEEESKAETPAADENTLATIKFEKPEDWTSTLTARIFDDKSNSVTLTGTEDGNVFTFVVPKVGEQGNEFENPKVIFQCSLAGMVVETGEAVIDGDKTYTVGEATGRGKFALVEK